MKSEELTLQYIPTTLYVVPVDLQSPKYQLLNLDEYRTRLQDDNVNFMNMAEPTEIKYLNFAEGNTALNLDSNNPVTIQFVLSNRVFV